MAVDIKSKKGIVSKAPHELYMVFTDMRNFLHFLPEDKKEGVVADYDSIHATVQGFNIGIKDFSVNLNALLCQSFYNFNGVHRVIFVGFGL